VGNTDFDSIEDRIRTLNQSLDIFNAPDAEDAPHFKSAPPPVAIEEEVIQPFVRPPNASEESYAALTESLGGVADLNDGRKCELCPNLGDQPPEFGGRMLHLQNGEWIHINCAMWSAECYETTDGAIVNIGEARKRGRLMKCTECKLVGATVGCGGHKSCKANYHFACASKLNARFLPDKSLRCGKHTREEDMNTPNSFDDVPRQTFPLVDEGEANGKMKVCRSKNVLRVLLPVEKIQDLKLRMGGFAVHRFGTIFKRPGYHNQSYIYPVNYVSSRSFWSLHDVKQRVRYMLKITEDEDGPKFTVVCPDDIAFCGKSPEEAWDQLIEQFVARRSARKALAGTTIDRSNFLHGAEAFGLSIPAVVAYIERMPNANTHCIAYRFRYFLPPSVREKWKPRANDSGCARSEPYLRSEIIASQTGSESTGSGKTKGKLNQKSARPVATISTGLGDSMKYRHAKKILNETIRVGHSKIQGWGLFAKRHIPKDDFVIEYQGELIRTALCDKREQYYDSVKLGSYMFRIDDKYAVDATKCGSQARFVNHACEPNCSSKIIDVDKTKKAIVIYAEKDIPLGTELTYDYKFPIEDDISLRVRCNCGAPRCKGYMN